MKLNSLLMIVALVAVVVALLAWAVANIKNASQRRRFFLSLRRAAWILPLAFRRPEPFGGSVQFANIGEGTYEHGIKSYLPDAATTSRYLIYKQGTDADHCAVAGAGDTPLGSSDDQADAGIPIAIKLFGSHKGTFRVQTDGSIANGDLVKTGAAGQATKAAAKTDGGYFGRANFGTDTLGSATAGETITVEAVLV